MRTKDVECVLAVRRDFTNPIITGQKFLEMTHIVSTYIGVINVMPNGKVRLIKYGRILNR